MFKWLTSQDVFEIKDEIEEVNRKMLEKLLDENDFVAVYFCEFLFVFVKYVDILNGFPTCIFFSLLLLHTPFCLICTSSCLLPFR